MADPDTPKRTVPTRNIGRRGAEETGECTRTLNAFGWQVNEIDPHGQEFNDFARSGATRPMADLACGFGFSTLALLKESTIPVIANDLSEEHLAQLLTMVTPEQRRRLTVIPGNALELQFEPGSLDGCQALRFLHFLHPAEIRRAFENFGRWIAPGGKLCMTSGTPYLIEAKESGFLQVYEQRKASGDEWPGYMTADNVCWPEGISVDHGYLFDKDVLQREATRAGFRVDRLEYIARDYAYTNGQENIGLLATKL
ncbi:uncharacterized protein LOC129587395 [Paramacrobiotus metropolitanus]|uniref:uncharacterized protein LOC129587395 n=1 Tax=Paramacrobiotus metropolitanus TaxID=2943436 RepID=UPI002445988A|nr:uncharacterized protein LOC129587395 [Paramacrobiotus metropolitanus]